MYICVHMMYLFFRLVTPYSKLHFRVLNHSSLMKDGLLGEGSIDLYKILVKQDGKCKFSFLTLSSFN